MIFITCSLSQLKKWLKLCLEIVIKIVIGYLYIYRSFHFCERDSPSNYCECGILANFNPVFQEI